MIKKSNITVLLLTLQLNYMLNVKEINFMDKLRIHFESFLMLIVSVNSILYLCILKIKASFSSYIDDSPGSIELILKQV